MLLPGMYIQRAAWITEGERCTEIASGAIGLRTCYAMSSTEMAHGACYAMSGTEIAYGAGETMTFHAHTDAGEPCEIKHFPLHSGTNCTEKAFDLALSGTETACAHMVLGYRAIGGTELACGARGHQELTVWRLRTELAYGATDSVLRKRMALGGRGSSLFGAQCTVSILVGGKGSSLFGDLVYSDQQLLVGSTKLAHGARVLFGDSVPS
eukprot:702937-Rhodomonas_salina.1